MKLTVKERLVLSKMLSEYSGGPSNIKILSKLNDVIAFSQEELDYWGFPDAPDENGNIHWSPDVPQEAEIDISKRAEHLIADMLDRIGRDNKLTLDHASLCNKFLGDNSEEEENG